MFFDELYQKQVADNEKNLQFWENYLNGLKSLNFDAYTEQLKVPILVPIGSKILFRGHLKHTNEVTVALGADYFVKCSIAQAEILKQHRIQDAQSKLDLYRKEKEYLENRISFTKESIFDKDRNEILEVYSEEEDKAWRKAHKENVRKYKQGKAKEELKPNNDVSDAELWERLEELELQEELENEMLDNFNEIKDKRKENTFLSNEEALLRNTFKEENKQKCKEMIENTQQKTSIEVDKPNEKEIKPSANTSKQSSKHDLLQKVLDKQNELENKLYEIKNREREQSKTEQDLISRLDEMEQLDELEDEMERLDDILDTEDVQGEEDSSESNEDTNKATSTKLKKSISFADDNDGETLEITFKHSDVEPCSDVFDPEKGITKPSDIYEAYSHNFDNKTTSILKKSKYGNEVPLDIEISSNKNKQVMFKETAEDEKQFEDRAIVIKDVVENVGVNQHKIEGGARPTSLFKKKRMNKAGSIKNK